MRQDNDPSFFLCARCGHDAVCHKDMRFASEEAKKKPRGRGEAGMHSSLPKAPESMPTSNLATDSITQGMAPQRFTNAGAGTRGGIGNSPYYYAHNDGRPKEHTVPTVPKQVGADGQLKPWQGAAAAAGAAERDDWEAAEMDPTLLREVDPFAAAGTAAGGGGAADVSDPLDPLAAAANSSQPSDGLADADPLCMVCDR